MKRENIFYWQDQKPDIGRISPYLKQRWNDDPSGAIDEVASYFTACDAASSVVTGVVEDPLGILTFYLGHKQEMLLEDRPAHLCVSPLGQDVVSSRPELLMELFYPGLGWQVFAQGDEGVVYRKSYDLSEKGTRELVLKHTFPIDMRDIAGFVLYTPLTDQMRVLQHLAGLVEPSGLNVSVPLVGTADAAISYYVAESLPHGLMADYFFRDMEKSPLEWHEFLCEVVDFEQSTGLLMRNELYQALAYVPIEVCQWLYTHAGELGIASGRYWLKEAGNGTNILVSLNKLKEAFLYAQKYPKAVSFQNEEWRVVVRSACTVIEVIAGIKKETKPSC